MTRPEPVDGGPNGHAARRQAALLRLSAEIAAAPDEEEICRAVVNGLRDHGKIGRCVLKSVSESRT